MLTINDLKKANLSNWKKGYRESIHSHYNEIKVRMRDESKGGKQIGLLILNDIGDNLHEVEYSICDIKGLGKHLYYAAMAKVYPEWICPDRNGCSEDAARVYKSFEEVEYVEVKNILKSQEVYWQDGVSPDEKTDVLINKMYRFSGHKIRTNFKTP